MSRLTIIVATHKDYPMPEGSPYLPLLVGAEGRPEGQCPGMRRDDEGENISQKNANYCELTGLYWAWKNLEADFLGLVHYRRYFARGLSRRPRQRIADEVFYRERLARCGVLLPKRRRYWIETNWSQYANAHHEADLVATRDALWARCPDYLPAFDRVMGKRSGHRFNMFVMERSFANQYCEWLFDVLFEVERKLDISGYSPVDARVFGYLSERLLDVWLLRNEMDYEEAPVVNLESQRWPRKVWRFLVRKARGKNNDASTPSPS